MRAIVLGGTSFIGPAVLDELIGKGCETAVFNRGRGKSPLPAGVERISGDRRRLAESKSALRAFKPDVVIDMIAFIETDAFSLLDVFAGFARRAVVVSSLDVYLAYGKLIGIEQGAPDPSPLSEDSPLRNRLYPYRGPVPRAADDPRRILDDYDKIPIERAVLCQTALPAAVVRLPMVYGPRDYQHRMFEYLKRMDDGRPAIILEETAASWRDTRGYVENMAAAIAAAALATEPATGVFNAGEERSEPLEEWVAAIGRAAGWNGRIARVPAGLLPDSMKASEDFRHDLVADTSRIRKELGFREKVPIDAAIQRTVEWERAHPPAAVDPARFDYAAEDAALAASTCPPHLIESMRKPEH